MNLAKEVIMADYTSKLNAKAMELYVKGNKRVEELIVVHQVR
jgi:hypothetical protein